MQRLLSAVAVLAVLAVAGCGDNDTTTSTSTSTSTATGATVEQTFTDPKQPIEVATDSEFAIVLDSNPSTGYSWKVEDISSSGATFVDSKYHADPNPEGLVGAGGSETLTFKAGAPGEATIELEYVGPGTDAEVASKRSIEVTVTD